MTSSLITRLFEKEKHLVGTCAPSAKAEEVGKAACPCQKETDDCCGFAIEQDAAIREVVVYIHLLERRLERHITDLRDNYDVAMRECLETTSTLSKEYGELTRLLLQKQACCGHTTPKTQKDGCTSPSSIELESAPGSYFAP